MRVKSVDVSFEMLEEWLKGCGKESIYASNLPDDAKIVRIETFWYSNLSVNRIKVILVSEEWDDIEEGKMVPEFDIVMTETYDQFEGWDADDI